jgi:hypothetical protein
MISIVYGSLIAGLPNNQDAFVGGHGRHFAQYLASVSKLTTNNNKLAWIAICL